MLDREHEIAKMSLAAGNKDRAIVALRQRKYQEGLLAKTYGQLENLEQLVRFDSIIILRFLPDHTETFDFARYLPSSSHLSSNRFCMVSNKAMKS